MPVNFWMVVSNSSNFRISRDLGFTILGLKSQHRRKVQRIGVGDRILYFVSQERRFTATATATTSFFEDDSPIWEKEGRSDWPYRVKIKPDIVLDEAQQIDANLLAPRLDYVRRWPPENWYMAFQGNLHLLPKSDFALIEEEMKKLKFGPDYKSQLVVQPPQASRRKKAGSKRRHRRADGTPGTSAPRTGAAAPAPPREEGPPQQASRSAS